MDCYYVIAEPFWQTMTDLDKIYFILDCSNVEIDDEKPWEGGLAWSGGKISGYLTRDSYKVIECDEFTLVLVGANLR